MKIKKSILLFLCFMFFPFYISAKEGIVFSNFTNDIRVGETGELIITSDNAYGKIKVSIDDKNIASFNLNGGKEKNGSYVWLDDKDAVTVNIIGLETGMTKLCVQIEDMTTFDDVDISGEVFTFDVNIIDASILSDNNRLKSIKVDGYNLEKIDDNNYYLEVNGNVEYVTINVEAEDDKAVISNDGKKDLNDGDNDFEVVIISESGIKNIIHVNINKKNGFDDLNRNENSHLVIYIVLLFIVLLILMMYYLKKKSKK